MASFMDLCVSLLEKGKLEDVFETAVKLGLQCIAVNAVTIDLKGRGKKQQEQPVLSIPEHVELTSETLQLLKVDGRQLQQYSRLTAVLEDVTNTHKLGSPEVQEFDLLAVQPVNEAAFKQACTTLEVDIITIDLSQKVPFHFKRSLVNCAIERGLHFEILYSPAIRDSTLRQNTISKALKLTSICRGKNIIISSGCEKASELRGPYDVTNLGVLFGLSSAQSKDAVSKNCRAVLKHAEARKITKSVVGVMKASHLSAGSQWILQNDPTEEAPSDEDEDEDTSPSKKIKLEK